VLGVDPTLQDRITAAEVSNTEIWQSLMYTHKYKLSVHEAPRGLRCTCLMLHLAVDYQLYIEFIKSL